VTSREDPATGKVAAEGSNNMAIIRARAEEIAKTATDTQPTSLEVGYSAVFLSLLEAAYQVRSCADRNLTVTQMRELADLLEALAADTAVLGKAQTEGGGS
jgi:hypothetical protein